MPFTYEISSVDNTHSNRYNAQQEVLHIKLTQSATETYESLYVDLLEVLDKLSNEFKDTLDQENDRIGLSLLHPDLIASSIDIPMQRPKNLTGQLILTHIGKVIQSQESLLFDGRLSFETRVVKGVKGRGHLKLKEAKGIYNFLKKKRGIAVINNDDNLCLPRAIVVAQAYHQFNSDKTISQHTYHTILGLKSKKDHQARLAKELCLQVGLDAVDYMEGFKTFGLDEVKLFANHLSPKYGIAVHNSLTANHKIYESPTSNNNVQWINLLNLNEHFMPITKPAGFFGSHYWCEHCNRCYNTKKKHFCVPICVSCKTVESKNCLFWKNKTVHCNICERDFYGEECFKNHNNLSGKQKFSVCQTNQLCKLCGVCFNPRYTKHQCGYIKCSVCKKTLPINHECYMQPHKFLDEVAYENAGNDEEKIAKADALFIQRLQKLRYIMWDIETFALNQQTGKGQLVPYLLVAATACHRCLEKKFKKSTCVTCGGNHKSDLCITDCDWTLDSTYFKKSCWSEDDNVCDNCGQMQIIIQAGRASDLFKNFIDWILQKSLHGFTLVAHNGSGFDNHYLFRHLIMDFGLTVKPIFSGSCLLQFTVLQNINDRDYILRGIDSARFFLARLKDLPKQFGLDVTDMKKGFFPYKFDKPVNWNYIGAFPDLEFYDPNEVNITENEDIKDWHKKQEHEVFRGCRLLLTRCAYFVVSDASGYT